MSEAPATPRILVVEDDENLRLALLDNLEDEGYEPVPARNGAQARHIMDHEDIDLVILDIMLPDTDGYTLCRLWRRQGVKAMVIMLTARSLEEDIVKGFEAGGDDYVVKPYRLKEFLMRVAALLRRSRRIEAEPSALPGFQIDKRARKVVDTGGETVPLTRKEYDLLMCFLNNRNSALTRNTILDEVWGREVVVDERTVDNFVSNLKKKLNWNKDAAFRIATIRGVGYRMEIDDL